MKSIFKSSNVGGVRIGLPRFHVPKNLAFMLGLDVRSRLRGNTSRDLRFIINYDCIGLFVGNGVILVQV